MANPAEVTYPHKPGVTHSGWTAWGIIGIIGWLFEWTTLWSWMFIPAVYFTTALLTPFIALIGIFQLFRVLVFQRAYWSDENIRKFEDALDLWILTPGVISMNFAIGYIIASVMFGTTLGFFVANPFAISLFFVGGAALMLLKTLLVNVIRPGCVNLYYRVKRSLLSKTSRDYDMNKKAYDDVIKETGDRITFLYGGRTALIWGAIFFVVMMTFTLPAAGVFVVTPGLSALFVVYCLSILSLFAASIYFVAKDFQAIGAANKVESFKNLMSKDAADNPYAIYNRYAIYSADKDSNMIKAMVADDEDKKEANLLLLKLRFGDRVQPLLDELAKQTLTQLLTAQIKQHDQPRVIDKHLALSGEVLTYEKLSHMQLRIILALFEGERETKSVKQIIDLINVYTNPEYVRGNNYVALLQHVVNICRARANLWRLSRPDSLHKLYEDVANQRIAVTSSDGSRVSIMLTSNLVNESVDNIFNSTIEDSKIRSDYWRTGNDCKAAGDALKTNLIHRLVLEKDCPLVFVRHPAGGTPGEQPVVHTVTNGKLATLSLGNEVLHQERNFDMAEEEMDDSQKQSKDNITNATTLINSKSRSDYASGVSLFNCRTAALKQREQEATLASGNGIEMTAM